jgi:hypothetical protein
MNALERRVAGPTLAGNCFPMKKFSLWQCAFRRTSRAVLAATLMLSPELWSGEVEDGFTSLFNGKDLTGWEGKPGWWRVEDGAITAESTPEKPCPSAHYFFWRGGQPGDFKLRAEYRISGVGANSGIQFRSRELPGWDTSGYQADLEAGDQWTGCLFEQTRGGVSMRGQKVVIAADGKRQVTSIGDPKELIRHVKKDGWNLYRVVAKGSDLTLEINGVIMCQATDEQTGLAARDGFIALQMHPGPPMKVQFRNVRIKLLNPTKPAADSPK